MTTPRNVPPPDPRRTARGHDTGRPKGRPSATRGGSARKRRFAEQLQSLRREQPAQPERTALLPPDPREALLAASAAGGRPRRQVLTPEAFEAASQKDPFEQLREGPRREEPTLLIGDGGAAPTLVMTPQQLQAVLPPTPDVNQAAQPGSALAHAQAAALAERLVTSIRLGRVGRDGHAAELRLDSGVAVRLRHEGGRLAIEVDPDPQAYDEGLELVERLRAELARRGVEPDSLELV